jgi:hypothetical protein
MQRKYRGVMKMQNDFRSPTRTIFHLSASFLFICISISIILGLIQLQRAGGYLDSYYKEFNVSQAKNREQMDEIQAAAKTTLSSVSTYFDRLSKQQEQLQLEAGGMAEIITEVSIYAAARGLEEEGALSPTDANAIANEAINRISAKSERWGTLAKAFNDMVIRQQRR